MVDKGLFSLISTDEDIANVEKNVAEYFKTRDELLLESIFKGVIKCIHSLRNKFYFIEHNDFYSDANLAMCEALNSYNNTRGYKFTTHYYSILRCTLLKRIRDNNAQKRVLNNDVLYLNATGCKECDCFLEDAVATDEDIFESAYVSYIHSDIENSSKFSKREKELFKCYYVNDYSLQDLVDAKLYANKQNASRANKSLKKKLKIMYGGC